MSDSRSDRDSITEVAEESFVRERPLEIERGAVLAGRYQVEEVIGKGGSGVVLRVFDRTVQNVVALKVLKSELARDAKWDKRFSRELRLGRPIQHRNVCRIFDIGEADGHRFLTMELATGGSLRDELKRRPALERNLADRLADARAAIDGLAAIHAAGVVHRDFKPDNLLRMEDGRLVISDFGLATDAASAPGVTVMIGTPHYMAPEVLAGEPATTRSDVWALGVVVHEIFLGRRPERKQTSFDGSAPGVVRPTTAVERAALELCDACLVENPGERPSDAREVQRLFADIVQARRGPTRRRWRRGVWLALPVSVALAVWAGWRWRASRNQSHAAPGGVAHVLNVAGVPADWGRAAAPIARFSGRAHCLSAVDDHTVRIVWGSPRKATDVDLDTGRQTPSGLVPDAYRMSCPDVSRKTGQVLFAARNAAGAMEIRLSERPDGADATVVTSGRDPRWIPGALSFLYDIDDSHAAIFSLPTMEFTILSAPGTSGGLEIGDTAVSPTVDILGITGYDPNADSWVELYRRHDGARVGRFPVPFGSRIAFGNASQEILIVGPGFQNNSSVALLDSNTGDFRRFGGVPGMDVIRVSRVGSRLSFLARRLSVDVWSYGVPDKKRLTADGDVFTAAESPSGKLLLSRRAPDGSLHIWLKQPDGTERQLTSGPKDATPAFGPGDDEWAYADYAGGTIRLCRGERNCRIVFSDRDLPGYPTFAPDGRRLAILTQIGRSQLKLVDIDGRLLLTWDALPICGAVWPTPDRVWTVESARGVYYWVEHDSATGEPTGARVRLAADDLDDAGTTDCRAQGAGPGSPLFRPIQTVADEVAELRAIPDQMPASDPGSRGGLPQ